jgi:hypothetical protein
LNRNDCPTLPDAIARSIARTHEISTVVSTFPISLLPDFRFGTFSSPLLMTSLSTTTMLSIDRSIEDRDSILVESSVRQQCDDCDSVTL